MRASSAGANDGTFPARHVNRNIVGPGKALQHVGRVFDAKLAPSDLRSQRVKGADRHAKSSCQLRHAAANAAKAEDKQCLAVEFG